MPPTTALAPVVRVDPACPAPDAVDRAAAVLARGGLVALPTETVYGLGADARSSAAVARIFAAKARPADNPLICHVADVGGLAALARRVPPLAEELAARWWPGPLTLVVDADPRVPSVTTGGLDSVAVRVPAHPVTLAVLRASGLAVAAPSANRSGRPSPTTAAHVLDDIGAAVDLILDAGPSEVGVESTVVDVRGPRPVILRPGAVSAEDLGVPVSGAGDPGASPGTRYRHYAPHCRIQIAPPGGGPALAALLARHGRAVGLVAPEPPPAGVQRIAAPRDARALARVLFAAFRDAEAAGVEVLVVEAVPERGLGAAVMERLRRAARH